MFRILVTGSNGQLGSEIRETSTEYKYDFFFPELDITKSDEVEKFISENRIGVIVNCGAYTNVDGAEENREDAFSVNGKAVWELARISKEKDVKLIHVSTDYIFDGKGFKPYSETDSPNPIGVYGKSKLFGENKMLEIAPKGAIIRTSWVYSSFGKNFVKTILKYGAERDELKVVFDQIGTPTYARDLAKTILDIVPEVGETEIFHYSNEGAISWFDFAKEIVKMGKIDTKISPIESFEFPTKAERPFYSVLNKRKIKEKFGISIPYWKDSLKEMLNKR
jgi:dTDP-4-dehydrorhamnose reductase